jgi:hypothetical protein
MGRGVNFDDIFMCGYNNSLWENGPDQIQEQVISGLMSGWKPTFVRVSLGMDAYTTVSWLSNPAQYKTPETNVIENFGTYPGVYVLVTLRSDTSMTVGDSSNVDPTWIPSVNTDAVYRALVDSFANDKFVMFGLSNEPGGSVQTGKTITDAMEHAVGTIRAEEDKLGVPHHIVSVQGQYYTSDLSIYAGSVNPITYDNVVYELHYYETLAGETPSNYAQAGILPMIVGEYGDFTSSSTQATFYSNMEAKMIPNLAWDFDAFSGCTPDLLNVTHLATNLTPSAWGKTVQSYLLAHP